jgi:nicotinamide-nucleotide amidase
MDPSSTVKDRRLVSAEILSIGTELTSGETRDTNAGELARSLTAAGVEVGRLTALPDRRDVVEGAFRSALERVDLVVTTGGLGPTPDDLTREAVAAVCAETPAVDPVLEAWLRGLWDRRGLPFPEMNLKQAWLIPSAHPLANPNGTAPGWWVDRPDGRVIVTLPGPPREMRPMWRDEVLPRLRERGLGSDRAVRTLRLTGIGESIAADRLGETLLRATNPEVATYARHDAVDVRMSAVARPAGPGVPARTADELLDEVEPLVLAAVGEHVWARGQTAWADALGVELDRRGWSVATRESGTGGALVTLLGAARWLIRGETVLAGRRGDGPVDLAAVAREVRMSAGSDVGLAVAIRPRGSDTAVSVAVVTPTRSARRRSMVLLGGDLGRTRAAVAAAGLLLETLRRDGRPVDSGRSPSGARPARGRAGRR